MPSKVKVYKEDGRIVIEQDGNTRFKGNQVNVSAVYKRTSDSNLENDRIDIFGSSGRYDFALLNLYPSQIRKKDDSLINSAPVISDVETYFDSLGIGLAATGYSKEQVDALIAALQAQIAQGGGGTTPTPQLATPTFGTPTKTASSINLSWNVVTNATEYVLTRNGVEIYRGALLSKADTGLLASTGYTYILTANAPGYLSSSSTIAVTTLAQSGTPTPTFPTNWTDSFIWDDNLFWNE